MPYVKEIDLENFKSFSGHIKLNLINGFNAIAGANGSGKSNIIDALMFAFGGLSKKEMRSELLADLIFNGGKSRSAADSAKVNVVFDNSDGNFKTIQEKEVSISRKIDKNGKSVFRVNGEASTREEVINVLASINIKQDGFNIIPQGRISEVVGSSSEERLNIIKDISGISIFEDKKSKAMNELDKVGDNISKIEAVKKEKKRLMDELDNEKRRAIELKQLKERYAILSAKAALMRKNNEEESYNKIHAELLKLEGTEKSALDERTAVEKNIIDAREEIKRINTDAESKGENEIIATEKKQRELDKELTRLSAVLKANADQAGALSATLRDLEKSRHEQSLSIKKEEENSSALSIKISELTAKHEDLTSRMAQLEVGEAGLQALNEQLNKLTQQIYEYKLSIANYPGFSDAKKRLVELQEERIRYENDKNTLTMKFSELKTTVDDLKRKFKSEDSTVYALRETALSYRTRLSTMSRAVEISDKLKQIVNGIHGTVSELFSLKNSANSTAVTNAIGRRSDFIIVDSEDTASECIDVLKTKKLGAFTFIPLNKITSSAPQKKPQIKGVIDYLINLVDFEDRFKRAFDFVFGDSLLVKDFESAKPLIGTYRMVTLDGTVFEKSGVIAGGYRDVQNTSAVTQKYNETLQEIEKHSKAKELYTSELTDKESTLNSYLASIKDADKHLEDVQKQIMELSGRQVVFEGSEGELVSKLAELEKLKESKSGEFAELNKSKALKVELRLQLERVDNDTRETELRLSKSTNLVENVLRLELDNIAKRMSVLEKERTKFDNDNKGLNKEFGTVSAELENLNKQLEDKAAKLAELRKKRDHLSGELSRLDSKRDDLIRASQSLQTNLNSLRVKEAESKVRLESARDELAKHVIEGLEISGEGNLEALQRQSRTLENKIGTFGPINELAVTRYDETQKEYSELEEKLNTLNGEKQKILDIITEIDQKKTESFMRTLTQLNDILSKVFNSITGGKAELLPENQQNVFDGGLDIKIDLPNKKIHNVRGLSGGEVSIVAIALLMAISKYMDVPFYVLDEVDAALDSVNSSKFSGLVKEYSKDTQFIIISHNENTLINADVIYGIVMDDSGVSKAVSVKMPTKQ